jgi:hypothetical protein
LSGFQAFLIKANNLDLPELFLKKSILDLSSGFLGAGSWGSTSMKVSRKCSSSQKSKAISEFINYYLKNQLLSGTTGRG